MHDAQYTPEEYKIKQGWGHSAMEDTIQFARLNEVKKLLLTHHDPTHTDDQLRFIQHELKEKYSETVAFDMAVRLHD
jgi:ribonuclease BN (tRNA processing enzyme)